MDNFLEHSIDLIIKEINSLYSFYNSLENKLFSDTYNNGKYIELYIIPKNWLKDWKKNSKYKTIENYLKKNNKKEINQKEILEFYEDSKPLFLPEINNNGYNENNNNNINNNHSFNLKNISFVDKNSWDLFTFKNGENQKIKCPGLYKKNKLIVFIEKNNCYYIEDFSINSRKKIYLFFDENNRRNSLVMEEIINTDNLDNFFNSSKIKNFKKNENQQYLAYKDQAFTYEIISKIIIKKNSTEVKNHINNINNINNDIIPNTTVNKPIKNNIPNKTVNKSINNNNKIYNNPCSIGLTNIGATCYMNAVLQCFSNINFLSNYLFRSDVSAKIEGNKDSKPLVFEYLQLIKHLWLVDTNNIEHYGETKSFSPTSFKNVLGKLNNLFNKNEANDSKDLIIYMEEELHTELNFLLENQIIKNSNNKIINQYEDSEVRKNFYQFFIENYKSIISDLFYGTQKTITQCATCGIQTFNYQIFSNLIFPLEAVREFKGKLNYGNTTYVTFEDCLDHFEQINYFTGMNKISCNKCRNLSDAYYSNKLTLTPNILIIILNRGKGLEFNVNLDITEFIDIKKYVENNNSPYFYELVGSIIHYGNSGQDGHFAAICKNKTDGQWYKYNDSMVNQTTFNEIKTVGIPYVLFYEIKINSLGK